MKNTLKLSNYLFGWFFQKSERFLLGVSLAVGIVLIFATGQFSQDDFYNHIAIEFRTYDLVVDYSGVGILFILGLLTLFVLLFLQINAFYVNGKGMYTIFTLPMKKHEIFLAFFFNVFAAVALYFAAWLLMMLLLYFPISSIYQEAASKAILRLSEEVTLTDLDTSISNGLFLAFHRSIFLSSCFPVSWIQVITLSGGLFLSVASVVCGGLHNEGVLGRIGAFLGMLLGVYIAFYRAWIFLESQLVYAAKSILPRSIVFSAVGLLLGILLIFTAVYRMKRKRDI